MYRIFRHSYNGRFHLLSYLVCVSCVVSLIPRPAGAQATLDDVVAELHDLTGFVQNLEWPLYGPTAESIGELSASIRDFSESMAEALTSLENLASGNQAGFQSIVDAIPGLASDLTDIADSASSLSETVTTSLSSGATDPRLRTSDYWGEQTTDGDQQRVKVMNWPDSIAVDMTGFTGGGGYVNATLTGENNVNATVDFGPNNPNDEVETNEIPDVITSHPHWDTSQGGLAGDSGFAASLVTGFTEDVLTNTALPALLGSVGALWSTDHRGGVLSGFQMMGGLAGLESTNGASVLPLSGPMVNYAYGSAFPTLDSTPTGSFPVKNWQDISTRHIGESDHMDSSLSGIKYFLDFSDMGTYPSFAVSTWTPISGGPSSSFQVGVDDATLISGLQPHRTVVRAASSVLAFIVAIWQVLAWWRPNLFRPGLADDLLGLGAGGVKDNSFT